MKIEYNNWLITYEDRAQLIDNLLMKIDYDWLITYEDRVHLIDNLWR